MDPKAFFISLLSGMIGTLGFALLFRMRKKLIGWAVLGGALTVAVYLVCVRFFQLEFFQNLVPALTATLFSELLARLSKSPATQYITCSIIPLVPGSRLYYMMYNLIIGDIPACRAELTLVARTAAGLAVGIIAVSVFVHLLNSHKFKIDVETE